MQFQGRCLAGDRLPDKYHADRNSTAVSCRDEVAIREVSMLITIELLGAELVNDSCDYRILFSGKYIAVVWVY